MKTKILLTFGALLLSFQTLAASASETLDQYSYLDPSGVVPKAALSQALNYYITFYNQIPNKNFMTVVDFTLRSTEKRMHIINMSTGEVISMKVAHGKNSDPNFTGYATKFSNEPNSLESSLGMYITDDEYEGDNGRSMRIRGLEKTNSNALSRDIVVHGASYVVDDNSVAGRSWGCPAVSRDNINDVINKLEKGSFYYIWANQTSTADAVSPHTFNEFRLDR